MKRGAPWYKREPISALDGYQGLGPELIGAYNTLLDLIYARGGETLRDDRHLAGVMGCSVRKAKALTDQLLEKGKIRFHDGFITNSKAEKVMKRARNGHETSTKRARNDDETDTNQPRNDTENDHELSKNNSLTSPCEATNTPLDKDKDKDKDKKLASQICKKGKERFEEPSFIVGEIDEMFGSDHKHISVGEMLTAVSAWRKDGCTRKDIISAIGDVIERHNYPGADKVGYFTRAIHEARDRRRAAEPLTPEQITDDQWRTSMRLWQKKNGSEWSGIGPAPGEKDCLVPENILAEFLHPPSAATH